MNTTKINKVTMNELLQLQAISKQTFIETFADQNTMRDMQTYLNNNLGVEKLTDELSNPNSKFYFGLVNNKVVAYLKINFAQAQTELKYKSSLEIERLYVLKDYHGKKIGQLLYYKAIDKAIQTNLDFVWLGVWEKNLRAINFYKKNGFVEFNKHIFQLGDDEQTDIMMRLKLK